MYRDANGNFQSEVVNHYPDIDFKVGSPTFSVFLMLMFQVKPQS